jgi:TRAP-type C4-dicarboxylate transport system substrate-binding protein
MTRKTVHIVVVLAVLSLSLIPVYATAAEKITLKFVDPWKPTQYTVLKYVELFKEIGRRSQGRLEIIRAGGSEIIPGRDQLTVCGKGGIDLIVANPNYFAGVVPEGIILGLPVVDWDFQNLLKLTDGVADDLAEIYLKKANVRVVSGFLSAGGMYILSKTRPVSSVDDLKGLKVRTYGGYDAKVLEALGATPTRVASPEIYTAAERGTIDGGGRPAQAVLDWREYEVWKYMTKTPYSYYVAGLIMFNVDIFNKLPGDLQKLIVDTCKELGPEVNKYFERQENESLAELASKGLQLVDLKPGELTKWQSIPRPVAEDYFLGRCGSDDCKRLLEKVKAAAK